MKRKSSITKNNLTLIGAVLVLQSLPLIGGPSEEDSKPEIVYVLAENGKIKISVNFHEPFRWEKTRYESIKKFPQPWIGSPDTPHQFWLEEKGVMNWLQTDMMFMGNYKAIGNSAKNILDQYTAKYGGIGLRTWSVNNEGNLQSFNETTGENETYTPEAFAKKFKLEFYQSDKYKMEASVLGYLVEIMGVFDPETNLLDFDRLDYMPFFQVPKLAIEESIDLKNWRKVQLAGSSPSEYQWPQELTFELKAELKNSAFYRVQIEEN